MSYIQVIRHIQRVLNQCGDSVILMPTGMQTFSDPGIMSIEINRVTILRQNNCFAVQPPIPSSGNNPVNGYWVNRIRISQSLADDYSKNFPLTDEELKNLICTRPNLFGYYQ